MKPIGIIQNSCWNDTQPTCILSQNAGRPLVRVVGLEPTRLAAQEPKGYVTLVKDFKSLPYHKVRTSFPVLQKIFQP